MGGKARVKPLAQGEVRKILAESKPNVAAMGVRVRKVFRPTTDRLSLN